MLNFDFTTAAGLLIASGVGAFIGAYAKKKGENLATREDVDNVVKQVSAVTQATKEIEAKISNDLWERQRKWDVKREALFETIKTLATVENALRSLYSAKRTKASLGHRFESDLEKEALAKWSDAQEAYEAVKALPNLVCGMDVQQALASLDAVIVAIAAQLFVEKLDSYPNTMPLMNEKRQELNAAIRKELGVDAL